MSTNIAGLKAWFKSAFPTRDWNQQCQAVMWQACNHFGTAKTVYGSANAARAASGGLNTNAATAPAGAFHYWSIGAYGHVALALGNSYALMGSSHITDVWGKNLGVNTVAGYASASGAKYLGWANTNGVNDLTITDTYGATALTKTQRKVLPTLPVKRRDEPSSKAKESGDALAPGTVGNFVGWITGESVSGNSAWFKGTSGDWFWSGGFTDTGTHDLTNLNAAALTGTQRKVLASAPSVRRADPSTKNPAVDPQLEPGTVGNFNGWINGETVSGNKVWFRGTSGTWFWSGGFTDTGTHDLEDLNVKTPVVGVDQRIVLGTAVANRRDEPNTSSAALTPALEAGAVVTMIGYAHGQSVSGNDVWFRAKDLKWSWSGGFTDTGTHDLNDLSSTIVVPDPIKITTFGIDTSKAQNGMDFSKAKSEGVEFVIVKMGGLNVAPMYTATSYAPQIEGAREAGLKIGHYWIIGASETPETQATYFVNNLHDFNVLEDVLALDNENLDGNGTKWNDDQVSRFFSTVIELTAIDPVRLWHYANASDYRAGAPWTKTTALDVKVWWAAYGSNPTDRVPSSEPVIAGAVDEWWVHQFSSSQTVNGKTTDGNWSKHTLDELFPVGAPIPEPDPDVPVDPDFPVDPEVDLSGYVSKEELAAVLEQILASLKK